MVLRGKREKHVILECCLEGGDVICFVIPASKLNERFPCCTEDAWDGTI